VNYGLDVLRSRSRSASIAPSSWRRSITVIFVTFLALLLTGCGDDVIDATPPKKPAAAAPAPAPAPRASAAVSASEPALPVREFQEADFQETDRSRDPFHSFEHLFVQQARVQQPLQRKVLVDRYGLDELRLVGVISRGSPRALLIDPAGVGWSAKVGDFVGKAEIVHSGGPTGADVAVNWRVDRVREADVVLVREDTSHPEIPPTTRVLALYPEGAPGSPNR
jgi:type IV pilus assembly protein PilP